MVLTKEEGKELFNIYNKIFEEAEGTGFLGQTSIDNQKLNKITHEFSEKISELTTKSVKQRV